MKDKELILLKINLQLFAETNDDDELDYADDDELESEDYNEENDTDDDLEGESGETDDSEEDEPADTNKPAPKDKVTLALIKQKQANKELKQRLEAFEQKERELSLKEKRKQIADKLIEKGYEEDYALEQADTHIENESIKETVKKLEFMTENADVLGKYPEAKKNVEKLLKLQKATGWDIEKICRMEFENSNSYDNKIKEQQEARLKAKKKISATPAGGQTPIQSTKLDPDDERAYQFYAKKNPGVSRKQYVERFNQKQQIPHDKWD